MASITMWSRDGRRCALSVGHESHILRVVDGRAVLREEAFDALDLAILAAQMWAEQEEHSVFGAAPPDRRLWL
jgi:hypothetical protein